MLIEKINKICKEFIEFDGMKTLRVTNAIEHEVVDNSKTHYDYKLSTFDDGIAFVVENAIPTYNTTHKITEIVVVRFEDIIFVQLRKVTPDDEDVKRNAFLTIETK